MRIALIGTGNVAWHLAKVSTQAGHQLTAITSRTARAGKEFIQSYPGARLIPLAELKDIPTDIMILTVPDAALPEVTTKLEVQPGTVVVHTSGSQPLTLLKDIAGARMGVFYPLQTFTKYKSVDFSKIPILIEGQDRATASILIKLGKSLSNNVQITDSAARKQLHLAAVFACNFTNHLFGISQAMLRTAGLSTDLLQPLIKETIAKAEVNNPFTVQTGPAARNDQNVIQEHIQMLQGKESWQEVYRKITESIQEQQRVNNNPGADNE